MGKRRRESARRMCKRPRPSSDSSPEMMVGGPSRTVPAQGTVPAGTALRTRPSGTRGATPAPSTSSSSGGVPQATPPLQSTPAGHAVATGRTAPGLSPSSTPAPQRVTPPTPLSSGSSSGGPTGTSTQTASLPIPTFITRRPNAPAPRLQYEKRYSEAELLLTYMETNCKDQADELWANSKWHVKIDFNDLKSYDRESAYKICNNFEGNDDNIFQGGKEFFTAAARTFLFDHFQTKLLDGKFDSIEELKLYVQEHANLSFTKMPTSIMRFSDIRRKSKTVKLFAGQKYGLEAIEASDKPRRILCKIVNFLLENHKKGWCWDGNWTVDDWEVINGESVNLLANSIKRVGRDQSDKDLVQLANSVLPTFMLQGKLPSFMDHLRNELQDLPPKAFDSKSPNSLSDHDFFDWFYAYIKYHPAMMSSLARSTLLQGFYFCMDKLDYKKLSYYYNLAQCPWRNDWRAAFYPPSSVNKVMYDIFWYDRTPCRNNVPHANTYAGMLGYHRHLVQHSPDNGRTQWLNGGYVQSMKNSDEAELIAALHDETLLPKFIRKTFSCNMMRKPEILKHFAAYMGTWGK